jgi:ATP-binding cassette, subfamily B, bacterial
MLKKFPIYRQHDAMDCGPTCLRMVAKYYGQSYSAQELRERTQIGKDGVNMLGISEAAESIGFRTIAVKVSLDKLLLEAPFPCIVHWSQNHFVVIQPPSPRRGLNLFVPPLGDRGLLVADPARGLITYTREEFEKQWATTIVNGQKMGVALLLSPPPPDGGVNNSISKEKKSPIGGKGAGYLWQNRRLVGQLGVGLLVASLLQLIFPFLTQSVVDVGIQTRNPSFVLLVLLAQLALTLGRTSVEFIRSWLLMHLSTRLNLSLLSDFLIKLTRLPLSFFDRGGGPHQAVWRHHAAHQ